MDSYQEFIYKRSYSRWMPGVGRRENWNETVDRYSAFFDASVPLELRHEWKEALRLVLEQQVMPSMRCLWSAGPALSHDNIAGYNCAYTAIDSVKSFSEILYILMNGAGVGFSTERQYINKLPEVPAHIERRTQADWVVEDSKLGWAIAYNHLLVHLFSGTLPQLVLDNIRPAGAPLHTFGGRASGPAPFHQLIKFTVNTFMKARGRKLNSLEVYDLVCMVANCVVSGGVRRSSTINLSNLSDTRMRDAKQGAFFLEHPQRMLSNNSVCYTEKPDPAIFMEEWLALMKSGSGERGIVNRESFVGSAAKTGRLDSDYGTNPCGEIILRNKQFCNLTEVIVRPGDTAGTLVPKIRAAALLGVLQASLTDFQYLGNQWKRNCEEERLLGLSLTGLMDNLKVWDSLRYLRDEAWHAAREFSKAIGIGTPKAVTCVKPSGTVSQLVGCASGIHPRHAPFYIRRVRVATSDPVATFLKAHGVPYFPEVGQVEETANTLVFEFPQKAPPGSVFKDELTALGQLQGWLRVKKSWCDHNPSCTIYVKPEEWLEVGAWVYKNWEWIGGLSFLPTDGGVYELAPYEAITEQEYNNRVAAFPSLNWDSLNEYELQDQTDGAKTYACTGDKCEIL